MIGICAKCEQEHSLTDVFLCECKHYIHLKCLHELYIQTMPNIFSNTFIEYPTRPRTLVPFLEKYPIPCPICNHNISIQSPKLKYKYIHSKVYNDIDTMVYHEIQPKYGPYNILPTTWVVIYSHLPQPGHSEAFTLGRVIQHDAEKSSVHVAPLYDPNQSWILPWGYVFPLSDFILYGIPTRFQVSSLLQQPCLYITLLNIPQLKQLYPNETFESRLQEIQYYNQHEHDIIQYISQIMQSISNIPSWCYNITNIWKYMFKPRLGLKDNPYQNKLTRDIRPITTMDSKLKPLARWIHHVLCIWNTKIDEQTILYELVQLASGIPLCTKLSKYIYYALQHLENHVPESVALIQKYKLDHDDLSRRTFLKFEQERQRHCLYQWISDYTWQIEKDIVHVYLNSKPIVEFSISILPDSIYTRDISKTDMIQILYNHTSLKKNIRNILEFPHVYLII